MPEESLETEVVNGGSCYIEQAVIGPVGRPGLEP